jgi:hypothetical protein
VRQVAEDGDVKLAEASLAPRNVGPEQCDQVSILWNSQEEQNV